jgi:hypothetical protein
MPAPGVSDIDRRFAVVVHDVAPAFLPQLARIAEALAPRIGRELAGAGPGLSAARAGGGRLAAGAGPDARPALGVPAMIGPLRAAFHRRLRRRAGHLAGRIAPHLPTGATVLR